MRDDVKFVIWRLIPDDFASISLIPASMAHFLEEIECTDTPSSQLSICHHALVAMIILI